MKFAMEHEFFSNILSEIFEFQVFRCGLMLFLLFVSVSVNEDSKKCSILILYEKI